MNRENILRVADLIESGRYRFSMSHVCHCIIGHAVKLGLEYISNHHLTAFFGDDFATYPNHDGGATCNNHLYAAAHAHATREQAVICLRNLAATGRVDWRLAVAGVKLYDDGNLDEPIDDATVREVEVA